MAFSGFWFADFGFCYFLLEVISPFFRSLGGVARCDPVGLGRIGQTGLGWNLFLGSVPFLFFCSLF